MDGEKEQLCTIPGCHHPVSKHTKQTPNRDLRTCAECEDPHCLVHAGFLREVAHTHARLT